jgi:eukaryotic-like serine/threonine-protein kinase
MNEDQWRVAWKLYQASASMPDAEVQSLLDSSIDTPEVREAVLRMRQMSRSDESRTQTSAPEGEIEGLAPVGIAGATIGRYTLVEKLGEGGMGEVWLADQTEPVRRRVALKLIKAGMNSREVVRRFESERQALALMDHPAIAKVFDAGSTPQGTPYFVMEYVSAEPITAYCDNHRLGIRERLELFRLVCDAVQHAHQKAIIHRDLKPSNILVTEVDGRAMPKVIDFGIARALTQNLPGASMLTRQGALIGTLEYMSPEQALTSGEDIDTRTDVYSLGVVFYELVTGARPIDPGKLSLAEFLRRLEQTEPLKPSTQIGGDAATLTEVAGKRRSEPPALVRQLRGDLDAIALKALEKDRSRRYSAPAEFAADIGRYLRNESVLAVAPSAAYRARKFARRHRAALVTASAFFLVLVAAAVVSIREGIRANREAAVAQAVNDFLQKDLLAQASSSTQSGSSAKPNPDLKVRTALDMAAAKISGKFARQPAIEASLRETIGRTYSDLGLFPEARKQLELALDLYRRTTGEKDPAALKTLGELGHVLWLQGNYADAEKLFTHALELDLKVFEREHPETVDSMHNLGIVYFMQGKYEKAEQQYKSAAELRTRILGPDHPDTLRTKGNLAMTYKALAKYAEAEALQRENLAASRRILGPEHPDTTRIMNSLANMYSAEGKLAEAEALDRETLDVRRRVLGPEHPETVMSISNLGVVYEDEGKFDQAAALYNEALDIRRRVLGPEHPETLMSMANASEIGLAQGQYARSAASMETAVAGERKVLGAEHPDTLYNQAILAYLLGWAGKAAEAEPLFRRTLEAQQRVDGPESQDALSTLSMMATFNLERQKYTLAEQYATQALNGRRHAEGAHAQTTMDAAADLALIDILQAKYSDAEPPARENLQFSREKRPDTWQRFRAESLLGAALAGQKKYGEAEPLLSEGYRGLQARRDLISAPDREAINHARMWLDDLDRALHKPLETMAVKQ